MITKKTTIYICEHCRKVYQIKSFAEKHEKYCTKNPINNRPCMSCNRLEMVKRIYYGEGVDIDGHYTENEKNINLLFCKDKNQYLYPLLVERKGNWYLQENIQDGEIENNPMPKQCDIYDKDMQFGDNMSSFWLNVNVKKEKND